MKRSTVLVALVASLTLLVAGIPAVGVAQSVDPIEGTWDGEQRFYAMLSPRFFTGPPNRLDFFLVDGEGSLRSLEVAG